jgi:hypothetical protein
MAKILRDLIYKANSISKLLERLKEGGVEWDQSEHSAEELESLVKL